MEIRPGIMSGKLGQLEQWENQGYRDKETDTGRHSLKILKCAVLMVSFRTLSISECHSQLVST